MAWGLALSCLLNLAAEIGLYGMALQVNSTALTTKAAIAMLAVLSMLVTA